MRTPARQILTHQFWELGQGCGEHEPRRDVVLFPVGSPRIPYPTPLGGSGREERSVLEASAFGLSPICKCKFLIKR